MMGDAAPSSSSMHTDVADTDTWPRPTQKTGAVLHSRLRVDFMPFKDDGWELTLLEPMVVKYDGMTHRIPAGFKFDGASIRYRAANAIIPRFGRREIIPALVHDWYYSDGRHLIPNVKDRRAWADDVFYELLIGSGANVVRSRAAKFAVQLFGDRVWRD